jgi:hypothetical protein
MEEASNAPPMGRPRSNSASLALAEHRAASGHVRTNGPSPAPTQDTAASAGSPKPRQSDLDSAV